MNLHRLRAELEARFGSAILPAGVPHPPREAGFLTGVGPLDHLCPGGVPRGVLSLWTGGGTSGRTAAMQALVRRACADGARVALVDAGRTLDAGFGCVDGEPMAGLWVARAPAGRPQEGAWAAEALLRAAVFDLVVLDGPMPDAAQAHRLRALAREHRTALVVSVDAEAGAASGAPGWRADVRLEFRRTRRGAAGEGAGLLPGGRFRRWARLSGGNGGEREVELVFEPADRLRPGAPSADRRPRAR